VQAGSHKAVDVRKAGGDRIGESTTSDELEARTDGMAGHESSWSAVGG